MPDDTGITLAIILTAGGAAATSALIAGVVQIIKTLFGSAWGGATWSRLTSFILSIVFVVWAYVGTGVELNATTLFGALLAWYAIARLAMAVYDDVAQKTNSLTGPTESRTT